MLPRWHKFRATFFIRSGLHRSFSSAIKRENVPHINNSSIQLHQIDSFPEIPPSSPEYESFRSIVNSIRSNPDPSSRFLLGFTCKVCSKRHYKSISKIAYNKGLVLVECDGCNNRHLIKDNIGWFKQ